MLWRAVHVLYMLSHSLSPGRDRKGGSGEVREGAGGEGGGGRGGGA